MFYFESLVSSESLSKVWKTANNINDNDDEYDLPEICRNLDNWISSETFEIHRRLSLRTSSTLVYGAAKLYSTGVSKLMEDVQRLDESMARRKREYTNVSTDSYKSSESVKSPEQMREKAIQRFATSITPNKRIRPDSASVDNVTPSYSMSHPFGETSRVDNSDVRSDLQPNSDSTNSSEPLADPEKTTSSKNQSRDQAVQTSSTTNYQGHNNNIVEEDGLNTDLPYGCVLVYDSYRSRVPSKIIVSSITSDVRHLN